MSPAHLHSPVFAGGIEMRANLGKLAIFLCAFVFAGAAGGQAKGSAGPSKQLLGIPSGRTQVIDLTHAINDHSPAWPGDVHPFEAVINASPEKRGYFTRKFTMLEHYGTHMDAPAHFPPGKTTVDQIPVHQLFGPAVVIDIRDKAASDVDYRLTPEDVEVWETSHGRIPAGAIVMLRAGWGARWPDAVRYRNMDSSEAMHFPGYSVAAAKLLIARGVSGLGTDTI